MQFQSGVTHAVEAASFEASETAGRDQAAMRAWTRLRPGSPELEKIEVLKLRTGKKRIVYRLCGAGPEGAPIIAKRCQADKAHVERFIYEEVLPAIQQSPRLHFYGFVTDPDDESYCWLFLEEAEGGAYSGRNEAHRALAARWVAALHLGSLPAELQGRLPSRDPAYFLQVLRDDRRILLEHLAYNSALPDSWAPAFTRTIRHLDVVESQWSRMEQICEALPNGLVHGDFTKKNLRVREGARGSELMVFDWELAGWGTPAIDLAQIVQRVASPDLDVYRLIRKRANAHSDIKDLQRIAACGNLLRLVKEVKWTMTLPEFGSRDSLIKPLAYLEIFDREFAEALGVLKGVLR